MKQDVRRILFSEEQIRAAVDALAGRIESAYRGRNFTVVSVLKGSCIFASDLIRRLPIPLELGFVAAESYRDGTIPGEIKLSLLPSRQEIEGRDVLLVDDILDTGRTLACLLGEFEKLGAASVATCVLFDKPSRRKAVIEADFKCFEVEDIFIVGYGLDYAGRYRNLPYVAELRQAVLSSPRTLDAGPSGS